MKNTIKLACLTVFISMLFHQVYAEPWFTGPLLAADGKSVEQGHASLETYTYFTSTPSGVVNRSLKLVTTSANSDTVVNPIFTYGLAKKVDVELNLPYVSNHNQGKTGKYIGDISAQLGWQIFEQNKELWHTDTRITLQEIFPTGPYQKLNPAFKGTDGSGSGSYQTVLGLNFQHLKPLGKIFYLRTRLNFSYLYATSVDINGYNSYGGNAKTNGRINPGNQGIIDLAGELSLTQNWVIVMEGYYFNQEASKFKGYPGVSQHKVPLILGYNTINSISLAPAIEYNFSTNYGIIAGAWYSVSGNSTSNFTSVIIAFSAYW